MLPRPTDKRIDILGVWVDAISLTDAVTTVDHWIGSTQTQMILAVNPEIVIASHRDSKLRLCLNHASLLIPDGIGIVIAARLLHGKRFSRLPGSELMPALCERAAQRGYRVFLFGASQHANDRAAEELKKTYKGIDIAGRHQGFVSDNEMGPLIDKINTSKTDILFVALGSPRQEYWINNYAAYLNVAVCQGVGGTFDIIAGLVKRAPLWLRRIHLEWLYRLIRQPNRILRQTALPRFVIQVLLKRVFG